MNNQSPITNHQSLKKIGITGQNGFVGKHLYNTLGLFSEEFERVDFQKEFFEDETKLDEFTAKCDVIVHLAAMNRHENEQVIYDTNIALAKHLVDSLKRTNSNAHILISSSTVAFHTVRIRQFLTAPPCLAAALTFFRLSVSFTSNTIPDALSVLRSKERNAGASISSSFK